MLIEASYKYVSVVLYSQRVICVCLLRFWRLREECSS